MLEDQIKQTPGDKSWFIHDRFGLFIHWGLYSMAARHEWIKSREEMSEQAYDRYFQHFDPDLYDPDKWAEAAAAAGMKYFVITTKHHDGFCLWDSALTDYKAPNTPAGRDLIGPMVEAFRSRGMRVGFYHSLIDWHHPEYAIDLRNHPRRGEGEARIAQLNKERDHDKYIEYLHDQVRELLTNYGQIDALWFDFSFPDSQEPENLMKGKGRTAWASERLYKMIRELAPNILLTDRLDLDMHLSGGDIKTPEQAQPTHWPRVDGQPVTWEACQTFSGSWGYYRDEHDWRSTRQLIDTLIDSVSKGGNLLLNVGPTGRGEFDPRALNRLSGIGQWMHHHDRAIYGCTQAPDEFQAPPDCRLTYNPRWRRLYVHLMNWPYKFVHLRGRAFTEQVQYAQLMHDASELGGMSQWYDKHLNLSEDVLTLKLPQREPEGIEVPVIELFLKNS